MRISSIISNTYRKGFLSALTSILLLGGFLYARQDTTPVLLRQTHAIVLSEWRIKQLKKIESDMKRLLDRYRKNGSVPGSVVTVYQGGKIVLQIREGDLKSRSVIPVASITKSFTAVSIMTLVDQGAIGLDDPVRNYFPGLKIENPRLYSGPITIRQLLNHTSGLPYSFLESPYYVRHSAIGLSLPVQTTPAGARFQYSNANYQILSNLIESQSGMSFESYMEKKLFKPMNLQSSVFDASGSRGAAGLLTNLNDLNEFARMLLNNGFYNKKVVIKADVLQSMMTPPSGLAPTEASYYGLGFRVIRRQGRVVCYYHHGLYNGTLSEFRILPQEDAYITYIADPESFDDPHVADFRRELLRLAFLYVGTLTDSGNALEFLVNEKEAINSWMFPVYDKPVVKPQVAKVKSEQKQTTQKNRTNTTAQTKQSKPANQAKPKNKRRTTQR